MTTRLDDYLDRRCNERRAAGVDRSVEVRPQSTIFLSDNDYLGLCRHPAVIAAGQDALARYGAGTSGSRLVHGTLEIHRELELALAQLLDADSALVFASGYAANLAAISALGDDDTLIVSDAHAHASLIDGCRLAHAEVRVVPHQDVEAVAAALSGRSQTRALVVVESAYSVLGDRALLPELADAVERFDATLLVDEAHGVGVLGERGQGGVAAAGLSGNPRIVITGSLSKALGSQGGYVAATPKVRDHLVNAGRTFIFDTALAPASVAAARAALGVVEDRPDLVRRLASVTQTLAAATGVTEPGSAVFSIPMGSPQAAQAAAAAARHRGVAVGCFRPPSTPDGTSRIRVSASAGLSDDEVRHASAVLADIARE